MNYGATLYNKMFLSNLIIKDGSLTSFLASFSNNLWIRFFGVCQRSTVAHVHLRVLIVCNINFHLISITWALFWRALVFVTISPFIRFSSLQFFALCRLGRSGALHLQSKDSGIWIKTSYACAHGQSLIESVVIQCFNDKKRNILFPFSVTFGATPASWWISLITCQCCRLGSSADRRWWTCAPNWPRSTRGDVEVVHLTTTGDCRIQEIHQYIEKWNNNIASKKRLLPIAFEKTLWPRRFHISFTFFNYQKYALI